MLCSLNPANSKASSTDGGKEGQVMGGRNNTGIRKSFETIIKDLGHENRTIDVLKVRPLDRHVALSSTCFTYLNSFNLSFQYCSDRLRRV